MEFAALQLARKDRAVASWMRAHGVTLLRVSVAIVFIWFGLLKPLGVSPANELVERTVYWVDPLWFIPFLGWWEVAIGVGMLWRPLIRVSIALLALQMPGTFLPLVLLPDVCFVHVPWAPTLEGQYIIKNLVLISAAIVIGGTVGARQQVSERRRGRPESGSVLTTREGTRWGGALAQTMSHSSSAASRSESPLRVCHVSLAVNPSLHGERTLRHARRDRHTP